MSGVAESLHELLRRFVQHRVVRDVVDPLLQFLLGRQLAEQQQVSNFQKRAALGQNFNRIAAIAQDPFVAVNVGNGALAWRGVHERRVVRHQPEVLRAGFDLPQIHGPDRAVLDGHGVGLISAIVGDGESVLWHEMFLEDCGMIPT